ncbi:acyltransferase family protein [Flavitalea flava]
MSPSSRFTALDVFRGMTVCFMIIVNTPGNGSTTFAPLLHADWHGFTLTDLMFPSFLFAIGNAMSFATEKWKTMEQSQVLYKIFKRTLLIFLLGFALQWFPGLDHTNHFVFKTFAEIRIMGVLQRIAISYALASLLLYYGKPKTVWTIPVALLLVYWGGLYLFGDPGAELTPAGNAIRKFDLWIMGPHHMQHDKGIAFEQQGWLANLSSIVNILAGFWVGQFIRQKGKSYEGLAKLLVTGFALYALACLWDLSFPINKRLWTSSYTLYTIALDCMILGSIIFVIDFWGKTKWTPFFEVFGKNPLFIYIFSEVAAWLLFTIPVSPGKSIGSWIFELCASFTGNYGGSLLAAILFMLFCWLVAWLMDKKKIYVKV